MITHDFNVPSLHKVTNDDNDDDTDVDGDSVVAKKIKKNLIFILFYTIHCFY